MNQGKAVDVHDIHAIKQDERVRAQLISGHCIGCFYVESPAMRGLLKKNCAAKIASTSWRRAASSAPAWRSRA